MTLVDRSGAHNRHERKCAYRLTVKQLVCLLALCAVSLTASATLKAQDEETTRKLWDTAFINPGQKKTPTPKEWRRCSRSASPRVSSHGVHRDSVVCRTPCHLRRVH